MIKIPAAIPFTEHFNELSRFSRSWYHLPHSIEGQSEAWRSEVTRQSWHKWQVAFRSKSNRAGHTVTIAHMEKQGRWPAPAQGNAPVPAPSRSPLTTSPLSERVLPLNTLTCLWVSAPAVPSAWNILFQDASQLTPPLPSGLYTKSSRDT